GFHWGQMLRKHGTLLSKQIDFVARDEKKEFARNCIPIYEEYYPEVIQEIRGLADGQEDSFDFLSMFLLSMYCFEFENHCTCFACKDRSKILFGRNSDFLVKLEKSNLNCVYQLDNVYAFNGNTTAFIQMEDGMNEHGLAVGLTFIYPKVRDYGLNAGMLVRYILEKCKTTQEALDFLKRVPIASQQTLTIVDSSGDMIVVECNPYTVEVIRPNSDGNFVVTANNFNSLVMEQYKYEGILDDWKSEERYNVAYNALKNCNNIFSVDTIKDILSGKYGFMCQYDRSTGADTVWSVIYDVKNKIIHRVEGNPSRKRFKQISSKR
ncbi:MAG: C45 family peptidase, partial [Longicatena sp.]